VERSLLEVVAVCCIAATSGVALAQPCDRALPAVTGQRSPCAGVLIPTAEANKALACLRFDLPECMERKDAVSRLCEVDKSALETLLGIERERVRLYLVAPKVPAVSGWAGEAVAFGLGLVVSAVAAYAWSEARD